MKSIVISIFALFLMVVPAQALVETGSPLPEISLPDSDQQPQSLPQLASGKVTMVVYWSLTCPHCHQYMPHLLFLNKRLTGNNFVMIFVNSDGMAMAQAVAKFGQEMKMPAPWLIDEGENDSMPLAQVLDIYATPSVFVYDVNGKLVTAQESELDLDKLEQVIRESF